MKTKILKKALSLTLSLALLATCVISPNTAYAADPASARQEAEDQGEGIHLYKTAANSTWSSVVSGGKVVSDIDTKPMQDANTAWPTATGLNDGSYNFEANVDKLPYVAYQVSVAEAGVYEMKVGYMIVSDDLATHRGRRCG